MLTNIHIFHLKLWVINVAVFIKIDDGKFRCKTLDFPIGQSLKEREREKMHKKRAFSFWFQIFCTQPAHGHDAKDGEGHLGHLHALPHSLADGYTMVLQTFFFCLKNKRIIQKAGNLNFLKISAVTSPL